MQRRQGVGLGVDSQLRADAVGAEREADAGLLEEVLHLGPERAFQVLRVGTLETDGDVGDRGDAIQVDEHGDQVLLLLPVAKRAPQQTRLAVLARGEQADVVAADDVAQELLRFFVPVDDVLGENRVGVDERVDVGDHGCPRDYQTAVLQTTSAWVGAVVVRRTTGKASLRRPRRSLEASRRAFRGALAARRGG
jgi:hypothetical protein